MLRTCGSSHTRATHSHSYTSTNTIDRAPKNLGASFLHSFPHNGRTLLFIRIKNNTIIWRLPRSYIWLISLCGTRCARSPIQTRDGQSVCAIMDCAMGYDAEDAMCPSKTSCGVCANTDTQPALTEMKKRSNGVVSGWLRKLCYETCGCHVANHWAYIICNWMCIYHLRIIINCILSNSFGRLKFNNTISFQYWINIAFNQVFHRYS